MKTAPKTRASLACESCRRRKVKCDAQTIPFGTKCTPCQQMDLPCGVDLNGDRRKSGSRRHVETLEQRILDLEGLLHRTMQSRHQSELPCEDGEDTHSEGAAVLAPASPPMRASAAAAPSALPQSTLNEGVSESLLALDSNRTSVLPNAEPCPSFGSKSSGQGLEAPGPTSQYHARSPRIAQFHHHSRPHTDTDELADLGIAVDTNTVQVKCRLLQSFFRYQPLWVNAVDKKLFWEHRASRESSMWYSNFLEAAMLASAARLSNSNAVRSLGEQYSIQAKAEITQALESPSAASVQGLLVLSDYEVSQGRERMGWQLCGMACRMLTDLGLHEPSGASEEAETTHAEGVRLHLLGACIALEGIWCIYLGRPSSIPRYIIQAAGLSCERYQGSDSTTLAAWLGLCGPMADICEVLNRSRPLDDDARTRLSRLSVNLHSWFERLPAGFVYDEPNAADLDPTAYGVHMQYYKVQILAQQASGGVDEAAEPHRVLIYDAAIRIIRLLLVYRQIHGTDRIRTVMLDAVNLALATLIDQYLQHPDLIETQQRDIQWLHLAIESMMNIQLNFPIIGGILNSLAVIVEGTLLAPLFRATGPCLFPACLASATTETHVEKQASIPDIFGNEQIVTGQLLADDLDQLSPSFMSWSNTQVESFWTLPTEPPTTT